MPAIRPLSTGRLGLAALLWFVLLACAACFGPNPQRGGRPTRAPGGGGPASVPRGDRLSVPGWPQLVTGDFEGVLHGSGPLWMRSEHEAYREALPDTPSVMIRHGLSLVAGRHGFADQLSNLEQDLRRFSDEIPMVTVEFRRKVAGEEVGLGGKVATGGFDRRLFALADMLESLDRPIFLRIGAEVNSEWSGNTPRAYLAAYRHIHRIFERRTTRVIYVWNCKLVITPQRPYIDYYPGDDLVDWWSIDLFSEDLRLATLRREVDGFLAEAHRRGKPVIVPECAPTKLDINAGSTWASWFTPFFELLDDDRNIKAFCYSNRDFASLHQGLTHWGDMRIDRSALLPRYRQAVSAPRFIHGPVR